MKHILLSVTVRHMYRSRLLTTILSRLGHSETYDFSLELETSLTKALNEVSSNITPQIVKGDANRVFHVEWDNLNKITTNVFGSNVVNSTAGIMIQEVSPLYKGNNSGNRLLKIYDRSNSRSLHVDTPSVIPPLTLYNRNGPRFPVGAVFKPPHINEELYEDAMIEYRMWMLARIISSNGIQEVPGFGGFISACGFKPLRKSTIEYFTPIDQPFTDYAVVEELLKRSEEATREVGQEYVLCTFDLGGCMKALPLIWKDPERYRKHIVTPGPFHTSMNYIGMLTGKKCAGSGYGEILLEAGLVTSGCLKGVLNGKAYAKALYSLKATTEALERLLFERYLEDNSTMVVNPEALIELISNLDREKLNIAIKDQSTMVVIEHFMKYEEEVRQGKLGKTAQFWLSVIDHSRLVQMLIFSVKTNSLNLFHICNGRMAELFFAFDGQNYSRYLTWLEVFLTNIEMTHPGAKELLTNGGIAVTRSLIPGACSAVDKTMEETFMKFAKSPGGFSGIFSMFGAYQRWGKTTSERTRLYEKMLDMCGILQDTDTPKSGHHRELEKAEIKKSEEAVTNVMMAIRSFTNPFTLSDRDCLYSLASGAPVSHDAERDVLRADDVGKTKKEEFIRERLSPDASKHFFDPIQRNKLKTMEAANKTAKLTAPQGKVIQYQEQSNIAFMILVKSQTLREPVDLKVLMQFPLTPVPHSLGTPDGYFNKTNKATLMNNLLREVTFPDYPSQCDNLVHIQDGNAIFHQLTNLENTFGGILLQILDIMTLKKHWIFSTDSYHADSIKAQERKRRGMSAKFHVDGPATRKPVDFKTFLENDQNKVQMCELLLKVWQSDAAVSRLKKSSTVILVVNGRAFRLRVESNKVVTDELFELYSNQEETDTRVVLYLQYADRMGFQTAVVRTPDTDIFFICLHHVHHMGLTVYVDIGTGKHRKIVDISELGDTYGPEYCATLLGFHVFTGEDVTSAFKGRGKIIPLRKLQSNPKFNETFRQLGDNWVVQDDIICSREEFVCLMYGVCRERNANSARYSLLMKMIGVDKSLSLESKVELYRLPPCSDNIGEHVRRVNYRVAILKRADTRLIECPLPYDDDQGWLKTDEDSIEPKWSTGPVLPPSMVDLVETAMDEIYINGDTYENQEFEEITLSDDDN